MKERSIVAAVAALVIPSALVARAEVVSITAGTGGDAYVEQGSATSNFGTQPNVLVKNTASDTGANNRKGYFRFDLSAHSGAISNASLLLPVSVNDGGSTNTTPQMFTFRVYGLNDGAASGGGILGEDWTEGGINWNNAPANVVSGTGAADSAQVGTGTANGGQTTLLGTFSVVDAPGRRVVALSGGANSRLVSFLNADTNKKVTFILARNTFNSQGGSPTPTDANANSGFTAKEGSGGASALYLNQATDGIRATSVVTDATWRTTSAAPAAGWNSAVNYNESQDAAGWQDAFKSPTGDAIWHTSNQSGAAPNQAWFRHVFRVDGTITSASGHFGWDDHGEVYINGTLVASHTGGAGSVDTAVDPSVFVQGDNVIAVHGVDTGPPFNNITDYLTINEVPEPAGLALLGVAGMAALRRRRPRGR